MSKHDKTLHDVFQKPTRADVRWSAVEAMVKKKGGAVKYNGNGSAATITVGERRIVVHRPHPGDIMVKPMVEDVREFLARVGITPEDRKQERGG
jgi:hypothetical protein